ncbi:hypothetical protein TRSC58_07479 [Trypanosoma rangeli SC58]|uniref:Transmembrane protein n=1 Tax=Trypanosoma rangeli SC58 TaxID=429131 RepID=A0A061IV75_TRYRA|nr:hypothetical protein TRSC58_07479 [Trypanosoma rangeli SC58]
MEEVGQAPLNPSTHTHVCKERDKGVGEFQGIKFFFFFAFPLSLSIPSLVSSPLTLRAARLFPEAFFLHVPLFFRFFSSFSSPIFCLRY